MNQESLKQILSNRYDRASWQLVLTEVFGARELHQEPRPIPLPKNEIAASAVELGSLETEDGRLLGLYQVDLTDKPRIWQNRVGLRQLLRSVYSGDVDAALVVFVQNEKWRLSLISEIKSIDNETGEVVEQKTEPKRYTYLLGRSETVRTPVERLHELQTSDRKIETLIKAFSVEALNKDFFREYKVVFDDLVNEAARTITDKETARLFAQRLLNRLMFLYFIQKKDWMRFGGNTNYLRSIFDEAKRTKQNFYRDRLYYVFFYGLSNHAESKEIHNQAELETIRGEVPYLNGGLFEPEKDGLDEKGKVPISNDLFEEILKLFERYNFTIDESTPFEVQVAVDPEMLGKVFEELVTGRHESGSYYTPRTVVSFMCREALKHSLDGTEEPEVIAKLVDENDGTSVRNPEKILDRLRALKICDPACGSGAYLLGMLQELLHVREALFASRNIAKDAQYKWKREIIENNIYGVDLDRFATQIASLRLWLSLAIESEEPKALPNLKYKIGCGDSLLAPLETDLQPDLHRRALIEQFKARKKEYTDADNHLEKAEAEAQIERLRIEIARTLHHLPEPPSPAKLMLARNSIESIQAKVDDAMKRFDKTAVEKHKKGLTALQAEIAKMEAEQTVVAYDTGSVFDWSVEFADVFEERGFDIILANPPYIQLQRMGAITDKYARAGYETFARTGDIYCLFYELGQKLLKPNGVVCYITSNKWMRAAYGANTRKFFAERTNPILLIDFAGQQIFEGASVDTNILLFTKAENKQETLACVIKEDVLSNLSVFVRQTGTVSHFTTSKSWLVLSSIERQIRDKIERIGIPLKDWDIQINYGVKTGFNDAFLIPGWKRQELIEKDPKSEEIIRPILRGRDIKRFGYTFADQWLINTHNGLRENGVLPINIEEYPAIKEHLNQYREQVKARADQGVTPYNLRNCAYIEDFSSRKIIWIELTDHPNFCLDSEGYFINNTVFFMTGERLEYILAFLNSRLCEWYFRKLAATSGAGTTRWIKMYIEQICIPQRIDKLIEEEFKLITHNVQERKKAGKDTDYLERQIDHLINALFGLTETEIALVNNSFVKN